MEKITSEKLYNLLERLEAIENKIINASQIDLKNYSSVNFINCVFTAQIMFVDSSVNIFPDEITKSVRIKGCKFNNCSFINCNIAIFEITDFNQFNSFDITNCKIDTFKFFDSFDINGEIKIYDTIIYSDFYFNNNNFIRSGSIKFLRTTFYKTAIFQNNVFCFLGFAFSNFKDFFTLTQNEFAKKFSCEFFICEFEQVDFSRNLIGKLSYTDCKFFKTALFREIPYDISSVLSFEMCRFDKYVQFNKSAFYKLILDNVKFDETASFQETYFDIISIERTIFEKGALFDDIQIKKIDDCNRRTIRTIKLQLQKEENKIDYNKFRVYEFNAYRKDAKEKLKKIKNDKNFNYRKREPIQLKRDLFVLWLSDLASEYGTDWKRALKFTLFLGFVSYLLFFVSENHHYSFDLNNSNQFISGFFRFFIVTDFYNPLGPGTAYLTNPISWFLFIVGKIIITFGIYELIQSFRKYRA